MDSDETFTTNLLFLKNFILHNNVPFVVPCGPWFERLTKNLNEDKSIRNEYLSELCTQLRNSKLEEPFTSPPPNGPLISLYTQDSNSWSDISTVSTSTTQFTPTNNTKSSSVSFDSAHLENKMKPGPITNINEETFCKLSNQYEYIKGQLGEFTAQQESANVKLWKNKAMEMEEKLNEEKKQTESLRSTIKDYETKISEFQKAFTEMRKQSQQKSEEFSRDINAVRESQKSAAKDLEQQYVKKLRDINADYQQKMQNLEAEMEKKLSESNQEHQKQLQMKDEEIVTLKKVTEDDNNRIQEEIVEMKFIIEQNFPERVEEMNQRSLNMHKYVAKMEKLLKTYEKHYSKKVNDLRNELITTKNSAQIQMSSLRAQMLAEASIERQQEIEEVVSNLETRYRALLEEQYNMAVTAREQDQALIKSLRDKLATQNIS